MKLLTKQIEKSLPPLYANDGKPVAEAPIIAKFFTPDSNWTWYVTEGDASLTAPCVRIVVAFIFREKKSNRGALSRYATEGKSVVFGFTRQGALVQSQYRPPFFYNLRNFPCSTSRPRQTRREQLMPPLTINLKTWEGWPQYICIAI